jgi:HAD superfamily hydrolase (TIGR01509 family)
MSFSAAVFDFGDTLFHSPSGPDELVEAGVERARAERLWDEVWSASKTPEELARGRDLSAELHRLRWLDLLRRLEPHAPGIAERLYDRVIAPDGWLPYPDAVEVLRALRDRGVRVGVLSNIPSTLRPLFERHGLAPYVDAYVESFRLGRQKPDPELFEAICRELDVDPAEALMVGDSHIADGAAVLAGMTALLLPAVPPGTPRGLARVLALCG